MAGVWKTVKLGELVDFRTGKLDSNAAVSEGEYPFFTCSQETLRTSTYSFDTECVLLAGNNANGIFPLKYYHRKFDAYQRTYVITSRDKSRLDNRFLYYALRPKLAEFRSVSTGAATKFLTLKILNDAQISLPPFSAQRRIASILGAYDDLIEVNRRRIALLEEMARRLFEEWFVRFRFPGSESHATITTPDGPLPQGWDRVAIGATLEHAIGGTWGSEAPDDSNTDECFVLRGTDFPGLRGGEFREVPRRFVPARTLSSRLLRDNDIVLEVSGGSKDQPVGRAVFIADQLLRALGGACTFASFCRLMRVNTQRASPYQLFWHVDHMYRTRTIEAYQSQSTGLRNFKFTVFSEKEFLRLPPQSIRQRFDSMAAPIMEQLATLSCQISSLRRNRDLLLPRLISGELSVAAAERELELVA